MLALVFVLPMIRQQYQEGARTSSRVRFTHAFQRAFYEVVLPTLKPSEQVVLLRPIPPDVGLSEGDASVSRGKLAKSCNLRYCQVNLKSAKATQM